MHEQKAVAAEYFSAMNKKQRTDNTFQQMDLLDIMLSIRQDIQVLSNV